MANTPSQKIAIIKEVIENKQSVYSVCKKYKISKVTFYKWLEIYQRARKNRYVALKSKVREGSSHYKSLSSNSKLAVLRQVHKNPKLSCHGIAKAVELGNHAVQNLLEKEDLSRIEKRIEFSQKPFWKRETFDRRYEMMALYEQGWNVDSICRHFKVSKPTFFKWRKRYLEAKDQDRAAALGDRYIAGEVHHKYIDRSVKDRVLEIVRGNPALSVGKLAEEVVRVEGRPTIGRHGIQDLLQKENLNTVAKRMDWAGGYITEPAISPIQIWETPIPKLSVWRLIFAPFKTVPKWVIKHPALWPVIFPATFFLAWVVEVDKLMRPVLFFPFVALTFGMFFFLYSLKYYFSLIMVMKVAQSGGGVQNQNLQTDSHRVFIFKFVALISRFFKVSQPVSRVNTLSLNLSDVTLRAKPFVSVHVPIFNEKRVIERLVKACSVQVWTSPVSGQANYEVILADDSTDETTEIIKRVLSDGGRQLVKTFEDGEAEIYISTPEKNSGQPRIKLIHRLSRLGFKGGALQGALEQTDKMAQYVVVFDADFVPYADTIEQFMKSFQEACGGLEKVRESKIAAVQGYQWHVLNKSENWVTRGVRTEYAGSYVVERAGIGIYGGLNQIAGSVFCVRADVLKAFGWQTSITEDLQLTLRLYEQGYKVVFNPYIQAPAEAVSTVKRLIRQRMRWAEGHTFNVKNMWLRLMYSKKISKREKLEFAYLAPYYLQATFFVIGVSAWFLSEVILHARLPFWTAAWGWSLVFTNFLALPLMNLAGLFLEESEERDYMGVASFILLSYVVVPFQAYAAVKALFENEEGPWFRTPKSGRITDVFDRGRFYLWVEKLKAIGRGATAGAAIDNLGGVYNPALVSAYNPLSGYKIPLRRKPRISRGVIAALVVVVLFLNSLAFLAPPVKAVSSTPAIEQQINIIDKQTTGAGVSTGIVCLTPGSYDGTVTYFFEVSALVTTGTGTAVLTYDAGTCSSGAPSGGSTVTISNITGGYTRYTSSAFTPSGGLAYLSSVTGTGITVDSARIIITQTSATKITKTEAQVSMGTVESTSATTYTSLSNANIKYYCFDGNASCSANSPTSWNPSPSVYFEATLVDSNASGTMYAQLYDATSAASVSGSEVSVAGTTYKNVRSGDISANMTAGHKYNVQIKIANNSGTIANANIVFVQTDATNGITNTETVQSYNIQNRSTTSQTYGSVGHPNNYNPANFSGASKNIFFESTIYFALKSGQGTNAYARLSDGTGEVSTTSTTATLKRVSISSEPAQTEFDAQIKGDGGTTYSNISNLVIQISSLQVPEASILLLPLILFLPYIVKRLKLRFRRRDLAYLEVRNGY